MKKQRNILIYTHALLVLLSWPGLTARAHAQPVTAQCRSTNPVSNVLRCLADRPCILRLRQNGQTLQVGWDGQEDYGSYNFRWSRQRKPGVQIGLAGGPGGIYEIGNLEFCSTYLLKVQGCNHVASRQSRCTAWATALFTMERDLPLGPDTCQKLYVWRDAYPGDHVCVTSAIHDQAAADNRLADSRRDPHSERSDSGSCLPGYVRRGITAEDYVCVTPQTRLQVQSDNKAMCKRLERCH